MNQPTDLSEWLHSQIGTGKRFKSARQMAMAAGLNQNAVSVIKANGRAEPETLRKLAAATRINPLELFSLAGWLTPEDVNGKFAYPPASESSVHFSESRPGVQPTPAELENHSPYARVIFWHTGQLIELITSSDEFEAEKVGKITGRLLALRAELLELEESNDDPLTEKLANIEASLRELALEAPRWVMERIRSMFSDQAIAASVGAAIGAALTKTWA